MIGAAAMAAGTATLAVSTLTAGTHQIFAVYGGDSNWFGIRSSTVTVAIDSAATTTTLKSLATMTAIQFTAALTPAASGGSVQFLDATGNTVLGSVLPVNGVASLSLNPAIAAQIAGHPISAVYSGTAGFTGSTSNPLVLPALRNAAGGSRNSRRRKPSLTAPGWSTARRTQDRRDASAGAGRASVNIESPPARFFSAGLSYACRRRSTPHPVGHRARARAGDDLPVPRRFSGRDAGHHCRAARLFTASQIGAAIRAPFTCAAAPDSQSLRSRRCRLHGECTIRWAYAGAQRISRRTRSTCPPLICTRRYTDVSLMVDGHPQRRHDTARRSAGCQSGPCSRAFIGTRAPTASPSPRPPPRAGARAP